MALVEHAGLAEAVHQALARRQHFVAVEAALDVEIAVGVEAAVQFGDVVHRVARVAQEADLVVGHLERVAIRIQLGQGSRGAHSGKLHGFTCTLNG
jgi:hypothetical protein